MWVNRSDIAIFILLVLCASICVVSMSVYCCMVNMTLSEKYSRHHSANNNVERYENVRFQKAFDHHKKYILYMWVVLLLLPNNIRSNNILIVIGRHIVYCCMCFTSLNEYCSVKFVNVMDWEIVNSRVTW